MSEVFRFRVEKLIRDGLPAIMRESGLKVFERVLNLADHGTALKAKLCEEAAEVAEASPEDLAEELADVLEVLQTLAGISGLSMAEIEAIRLEKRARRGGFGGAIYNEAVEGNADCPAIRYYLDRPGQYPRV